MTQEQKAKAYDEALERARKSLRAASDVGTDIITFVFPELCESKDERIRKEIKQFILDTIGEISLDDKEDAWLTWLEKQKEQIPYTDFVIKPHKGDDNNPYDMGVSEAQEYAIKRGLGIPFNDGEVYIDEKHMTQTIGNILRWADDHPKEQKPAEWSEEDERIFKGVYGKIDHDQSYNVSKIDMLNWLKSLRPQPQWKSSEKQMKALQNAVALTACDKELARLYDDLKKLM